MTPYQQRPIMTEDGFQLISRFYHPPDQPRGAVLIVPAMGVAQDYYHDFAAWLQAREFLAVTFDYRGIGRSRNGSLRGLHADIMTWAEQDCGAVLAEMTRDISDVPLTWVGHSLGGQIFPFVPQRDRVAKMITVATGSGYWRENAPRLRRMVWWLWYFLVPVTLPLFGYFPGRKLRKVGDLPKGVMAQWRRWCMNREYAVGVEGDRVRERYASVTQPITSFSFEDDQFMSRRNTESIHGFYTGAPLAFVRLSPADTNGQTVGHFGFFRARFAATLWRNHLLPELSV